MIPWIPTLATFTPRDNRVIVTLAGADPLARLRPLGQVLP